MIASFELERVARWGAAAAAITLILTTGCNLLTDPAPTHSTREPVGSATPVAPDAAAVTSTLRDLAGLAPDAAQKRLERLPRKLQTALRTKVQSVVKDLETAATDDERKADFELLPPEMQGAVRLALSVARVERSVEKVPPGRKRETRVNWFPASYGCALTAYNVWGWPLFAFHEEVLYSYSYSAVTILGMREWGACYSPMWLWVGVVDEDEVDVVVFADAIARGAFVTSGFLGVNSVAFLNTRVWANGNATFFGTI